MARNSGRKRKRNLRIRTVAGIAGVILLLILILVYKHRTEQANEVKEGGAYLKEIESASIGSIESKVKANEKSRRQAGIDQIAAKLENGEIDVWSQFGNIFWLGDSRAEAVVYFGYLDASKVYANKGDNLRKAAGGLDKAKAASPDHLVFSYGLNDLDGNWANSDQFINYYKQVIDQYKQAVPKADIYICSVTPVTDHALAKDAKLKQVPEYNQKLKAMCDELGYHYIDCSSLYEQHANLFEPDGIHYVSGMYPYWAKLIVKGVITNEKN